MVETPAGCPFEDIQYEDIQVEAVNLPPVAEQNVSWAVKNVSLCWVEVTPLLNYYFLLMGNKEMVVVGGIKSTDSLVNVRLLLWLYKTWHSMRHNSNKALHGRERDSIKSVAS